MTYKLKDLPLDDYTAEDEDWDATEYAKGVIGFDFSEGDPLTETTDRWITIKSKEGEDDRKGYRRILLNERGIIKGGDVPKEVQGTKIGSKENKEALKKAQEKSGTGSTSKGSGGTSKGTGEGSKKEADLKKYVGKKLVGQDFSGKDLTGYDFTGADLTGVNFEGANLTNAVFTDAIFANTRFSDKTILYNNNFSGVDFTKVEIERGTKFERANFTKAQIHETELSGVHFIKSDFSDAGITFAVFEDCNFRDSILSGATVLGSRFYECEFEECIFKNAILSDCVCSENTAFFKCGMEKVNFREIILNAVVFYKSYMYRAELFGANMVDVKFEETDLTKAIFDSAYFNEVDLRDSYLVEASFQSALINDSDFRNATLEGAIFKGVTVNIESLSSMDLSGANPYDFTCDPVINDIDVYNLPGVADNDKVRQYLEDAISMRKDFLNGSPSQNKEGSQNKLSEATSLPLDFIYNAISNWAGTSSDDSPRSTAAQLIAEDVFSTGGRLDHLKTVIADFGDRAGVEKLLKAQYDLTQEYLKEKGIKELVLFRGVGDSYRGESEVHLQPLSSFSLSVDVAEDFGNNIMAIKIPAEDIFSTPLTGYGCTHEFEVVVLGGHKDNVIDLSKSRTLGDVLSAYKNL